MLDIWDEMRAVERRLDDLFRIFTGPRGLLTFPTASEGIRRPFIPVTDVFSRDSDLVIRAELPGIDPKEDVSVTLEEGELTVRGERKHTEEIQEEDYYRAESSYGAFERHIPVPEGTEEKDVEATYEGGVLEVTVRKAAEVAPTKTRTIPVRTSAKEKGKKAAA